MPSRFRRIVTVLSVAIASFSLWADMGRAETPLREMIDAEIAKAWEANGIEPAAPAGDGEFLRRVYLDLLGTIPSYAEAAAFLADESPDKREKLIDRLLEDPRYAAQQADVWDMVLFGRNPPGYDSANRDGFQRFLREQFAQNVPFDQMARTILKGEGDTANEGAPMYLMQYQRRPEDAAVAVTKTFLGVQLGCARCHDHPYEDYSQVEFYGIAAFFARLQRVQVGSKGQEKMLVLGEKSTGEVLFTGPVTEDAPGKKGKPVAPQFLKGEALEEPELPEGFSEPSNLPDGKAPPKPHYSRKDAIAEWITRADNPWFARETANRVWGQFMGRGIVHPVDNFGDLNPPSHPELLDALERALVERKFDLKWYIRELLNSRVYQLSSADRPSEGTPSTESLPQWFERARTRPLTAEELAAAWRVAAGYDDALAAAGKQPDEKNRFAPLTGGYVLRFFGESTDGQGNFQGGLPEHLYLNNGELPRLIRNGSAGSLYHYLVNSEETWEQKVERLFVQMLSRKPSEEESRRFIAHLSVDEDRDARVQDAIWSLMTSSEFRFNH